MIAALVASGEPVLVACADARRRRAHLSGRLGGFALCSWLAFERDPSVAAGHRHLVVLDPPSLAAQAALARALPGVTVHLAWGAAEAAFARDVLARDCELRAPAAALYRALRAGESLAAAVAALGAPVAAGRALRALTELGLIEVDRTRPRPHGARGRGHRPRTCPGAAGGRRALGGRAGVPRRPAARRRRRRSRPSSRPSPAAAQVIAGRGRDRAELRQPPLEQAPLGVVVDQRQRRR